MKALEIIMNKENLLIADAIESKKMKGLASSLNEQISQMCDQINKFETFKNDELNGELNNQIIVVKSLAGFFSNNKILKIELIVEKFKNEEKSKINEYNSTKNQLLETIRTIMKECSKEAVVSQYDIFENEFQRCESGHEILIFRERNLNVLETFLNQLDAELVVSSVFDSIESQSVDFNTSTLDRNIQLCTRKNEEVYGSKQSKFSKVEQIINNLRSVGEKVVAFYTYKDALLSIGCSTKSIKEYENELSKSYIPLKKTLQKEFKIELEDICEVIVDEEQYSEIDTNQEFSTIPNYNEETSSEVTLGEQFEQPETVSSNLESTENIFTSNNSTSETTDSYSTYKNEESSFQPIETTSYENYYSENNYTEPQFEQNTETEETSSDETQYINSIFNNTTNNFSPEREEKSEDTGFNNTNSSFSAESYYSNPFQVENSNNVFDNDITSSETITESLYNNTTSMRNSEDSYQESNNPIDYEQTQSKEENAEEENPSPFLANKLDSFFSSNSNSNPFNNNNPFDQN